MATLSFTLSDAALAELVDAACDEWAYETNHDPGETRAQFARRMAIRWFRAHVHQYRAREATRAAQAAIDLTDPDIT